MHVSSATLLALSCLYEASQGNPIQLRNEYQLQPFHIDLSSRVPRMLDQIKGTKLPEQPVYINTGTSAGISLNLLESFQTEWLTSFDWDCEQKEMNKYVFTIDMVLVPGLNLSTDSTTTRPLLRDCKSILSMKSRRLKTLSPCFSSMAGPALS